MAHAALHVAVGMATAMTLTAPRTLRAYRARQHIAAHLRAWVGLAWLLGVFALIPSFLRHAGLPASVTEGWWMNVFCLHPLLNRLVPGGQIVGPAALSACLAAQYVVVLAALVRVKRAQPPPGR